MEGTIGEIRMFAGNFAPRAWAFCNGQLLAISSNTALFSILGTTYGGDGRTTFALPDLRGRVPIHPGTGPGLSTKKLGQRGGVEDVILNTTQMPNHFHNVGALKGTIMVNEDDGESEDPVGKNFGLAQNNALPYNAEGASAPMAPNTVNISGNTLATGGNQGHTNVQPFNCVNFIIALQGVFPSRN